MYSTRVHPGTGYLYRYLRHILIFHFPFLFPFLFAYPYKQRPLFLHFSFPLRLFQIFFGVPFLHFCLLELLQQQFISLIAVHHIMALPFCGVDESQFRVQHCRCGGRLLFSFCFTKLSPFFLFQVLFLPFALSILFSFFSFLLAKKAFLYLFVFQPLRENVCFFCFRFCGGIVVFLVGAGVLRWFSLPSIAASGGLCS